MYVSLSACTSTVHSGAGAVTVLGRCRDGAMTVP